MRSGNNINASGIVALTGTQTLQVKYIRRRMDNVGFPDFEQPMFFQQVSLPYNNLDRVSARYEARAITPWFTNLKVSGYFQDQRPRCCATEFPVQFPVPSPAFFPINVYRLKIVSDTEQHVQTPGIDVQATFVPARKHVLTAGMMVYSDRSQDTPDQHDADDDHRQRGARRARPAGERVRASRSCSARRRSTHPVRVPDASFRDVGVFAQDEWDVDRVVRVVAGLRVDRYRVDDRGDAGLRRRRR